MARKLAARGPFSEGVHLLARACTATVGMMPLSADRGKSLARTARPAPPTLPAES